ncbi:hypothetical protein NPIL_639151 [Nephila pilipes]|uniref:Uncharacterized protein n=1 Tax=Nephila pilipes TaxID=299642 RepID=A0A8X6UH85_NEPPI|nr:hypothetical protein NPIL_639151 [Nephila pilipes]
MLSLSTSASPRYVPAHSNSFSLHPSTLCCHSPERKKKRYPSIGGWEGGEHRRLFLFKKERTKSTQKQRDTSTVDPYAAMDFSKCHRVTMEGTGKDPSKLSRSILDFPAGVHRKLCECIIRPS